MTRKSLRNASTILALTVAMLNGERLLAQAPAADPQMLQTLQSLQQRLDQLEKQNRELQDNVRTIQLAPQQPPATIPSTAAAPPVEAKPPVAEAEGTVVGKLTGLKGVWTTGPGSGGYQPWFETEDKAFRFHVGARLQPDFIFGAGTTKNVEQGAGGTGAFQEGVNFRRARLQFDGWIFENVDFDFEYDFSNTPFNTGVKGSNLTAAGTPTGTQPFSNIENVPAPADVWAGINFIPVIGGIRVGNLKPAIGLDHLISSRFLDFMERSIGFDTYYNRNNGFEPGFMFFNNTENKMATYQVSITRTCNGPFGFDQGGGAWDYTGRLTWLPYYEDEGRCMMHLGLGAKWQGLDRSTGTGVANLNDRWLLRNSQSGLQNVVSLAVLTGDSQAMVNPEFFMNIGALSIQAEYVGSEVYGVTSYATQLTPKAINVSSRSFFSQTAYVQALYFLTGESRPYGRTALHGSGAAPTRVVPFSNFFWMNGENGRIFSMGAWQVGARYCYSTLDDGAINGGIVNEVTLGLNWFLNPNMKFQWNYDIGHRELTGGTSDGNYYGFGMRLAMDF